jgi:hypothetical protein
MFNHYFNQLTKFDFDWQTFGIVMQPNNIVDKLVDKYYVKKLTDLFLYQISYDTYMKNKNIFEVIFKNHYFVDGYKKLVLESSGEQLKICHIATKNDINYVNYVQDPIIIDNNYEIMFCLPINSKHCETLKNAGIEHSSIMTVFGLFFNKNIDFEFIKTYMI